jgi:hypothetical protein
MNPTASALQAAHWGLHPIVIAVLEASGLASDYKEIIFHRARDLGFPTRETGNFLGIQQAAVSNAACQGALLVKKRKITWE